MSAPDYLVILVYLAGMVVGGVVFSRKIKSGEDLFTAGGRSPWWVSGLSGFMTMFSAGTFVVWGGIAYRHGLVAVMINMCYGVAALLAGYLVAARWKRLGVSSAAEFLRLRFGESIVQFYTWLQGTILVFGMGGSIYALAVIACALMPIPQGHALAVLASPETGQLSVPIASMALCAVVILISVSGGLWAVLVTDVLQFVILTVSVLLAAPLILVCVLDRTGGLGELIRQAPTEDFLRPVAGDYTWAFLTGWVVIHAFKIGGEWAFVQRFTCVPTPGDARKSAYLFGVMYLLSPVFWMLPPLLYRFLEPIPEGLDAKGIQRISEQAYIQACARVLPVGTMGLMVAAMASATASMVTSFLNVYAEAFTTMVYRRYIHPRASEGQMVRAGRIVTVILGGMVIAGALIIPRIGYASYIIKITALLTVPLAGPTVWGLFSRKIGIKTIWCVTWVGFASALVVQFGLCAGGWLAGIAFLDPLARLVQSNQEVANLAVGIATPLVLLTILELLAKHPHPGWEAVRRARPDMAGALTPPAMSRLPVVMVGITLAVLGLVMAVLACMDRHGRGILALFALVQCSISTVMFVVARRERGEH